MSIRTRLKNLEASKAGGLQVFLSEPGFETVDGEFRLARVTAWNSTVRLRIDRRTEESDVLLWGRTEKTVGEKTGAESVLLLASYVAAL